MVNVDPWTREAFHALIGAAFRIVTPTRALLGMLLSESDGYPNPALLHKNPAPNAVGLNQILLPLLHSVGWIGDWEGYESLSIVDQLLYVERWIKGRPGSKVTGSELYLSNFLPAYYAHGTELDYLLCSPTRHPEWYFPNWKAFDPWLTQPAPKWTPWEKPHGEKGFITVGDLGLRIERKLAEPRGVALLAMLSQIGPSSVSKTEGVAAVPVEVAPLVVLSRPLVGPAEPLDVRATPDPEKET